MTSSATTNRDRAASSEQTQVRNLFRNSTCGLRGAVPEMHILRERGHDLPRVDSSFFVGKRCGDNWDDIGAEVIDAQQQVHHLLSHAVSRGREVTAKEEADFMTIVRRVMRALEGKDFQSVSHRLNEDLMFFGKHSPVHDLFDEVMHKCLRTAWCAATQRAENKSGFAVSGRKGLGKTTLLHTAALMSGLLIPNFQSVFVGLDQISDRVGVMESAIRYAAYHVGFGVHLDDPIDAVYGYFKQGGCAIGLFVDELPLLYHRETEKDWNTLHGFTSTTEPTFALASGSAADLPAMITQDNERLARHNVRLDSLNSQRLELRLCPTFSGHSTYGTNMLRTTEQLLAEIRQCYQTDLDPNGYLRLYQLVESGLIQAEDPNGNSYRIVSPLFFTALHRRKYSLEF